MDGQVKKSWFCPVFLREEKVGSSKLEFEGSLDVLEIEGQKKKNRDPG